MTTDLNGGARPFEATNDDAAPVRKGLAKRLWGATREMRRCEQSPILEYSGNGLTSHGAVRWLVGIVVLAMLLRLYGLSRHFFWVDEGFLFNAELLRMNIFDFSIKVWRETTYNPGWAAVLWGTIRIGGVSLWVARLPSCLAGVLNVALTYPTARLLKLGRTTALVASTLAALSWPQVEYSQQILPYAGIPLMTTLILGCLGKLDVMISKATSSMISLWSALLAITCTLDVFNHNSFLLLIPFLCFALLFLVIKAIRETGGAVVELRLKLVAFALCLSWVVLVSSVFYLAKRGDGYRGYLDPFYLGTFRNHAMGYGPFTDSLYKHAVTQPNRLLDGLYFGISRTYDTFAYSVNLFSPIYVTIYWGVAALLPVGLVFLGLGAALRGCPLSAPRWLGLGLLLSLGVLYVLSALRLYPLGGCRQLLFLSPIVILMAAAGWGSAWRRYPTFIGVVTVTLITAYAFRAPGYYAQTAWRFDEQTAQRVIRETGISTMVVPNFGENCFTMRYVYRKSPGVVILDTIQPAFTELLHRHQPFLLYCDRAGAPYDPSSGSAKSPVTIELTDRGIDLSDYVVTTLIAEEGGYFRGGQPCPSTFLYCVRPKVPPSDDSGGSPPRVVRTDPAAGCRTGRQLVEIAVVFSRPMDPSTLNAKSIELWTKSSSSVELPYQRVRRKKSPSIVYDRLWKTATVRFTEQLDPGLYEIVVTDDVRDADGRPLDRSRFYSTFLLED